MIGDIFQKILMLRLLRKIIKSAGYDSGICSPGLAVYFGQKLQTGAVYPSGDGICVVVVHFHKSNIPRYKMMGRLFAAVCRDAAVAT